MSKKKVNESDDIISYEDLRININRGLAVSRGLSDAFFEQIKGMHKVRLIVLCQMRRTEDKTTLQALAKVIESIDFELQDLWGFQRDKRFHKWYDLPGCTCPKLDNKDRTGTDFGVIDPNCPHHGDIEYDEVHTHQCNTTGTGI